jgi:hypothetical protein
VLLPPIIDISTTNNHVSFSFYSQEQERADRQGGYTKREEDWGGVMRQK